MLFRIKYFLFALFLFLSACDPPPASVESVLESAGSNRAELEKVIAHYKRTNEAEKLQAAYFTIENMKDHYSFDSERVRDFDVIFDILDSLYEKNDIPDSLLEKNDILDYLDERTIKRRLVTHLFKEEWDSIVNVYGRPGVSYKDVVLDSKSINADFLIDNIDLAFKQWKNYRFIKSLSFEEFCRYILPYRIRSERVENWRKHLSEKYKTFRDTVEAKDRTEFTEKLYAEIAKFLYPSTALSNYPYHVAVSQMEKSRQGECVKLVAYTTVVMRANGIPVETDYAKWGDATGTHYWHTLLLENGKRLQFEAGYVKIPYKEIKGYGPYKVAKVYRTSFAKLKKGYPDEIPEHLTLPFAIDVTSEYLETFDISVPLTQHPEYREKPVVILTFDRDWRIFQSLGEVNNNIAEFKNMGPEILYIAMYYDEGTYIPASDPFILDKNGKLNYLEFNDTATQDMHLLRKYPYRIRNVQNATATIGARIQGANRPDFNDSVTLFTITTLPVDLEETVIDNPKKFRYIRYIPLPGHSANIAELEFYGSNGSKLKGEVIGFPEGSFLYEESFYKNAFDNDLGTFFSAQGAPLSWAGLKLPKPDRITKVKYCPRSDTNFIVAGDDYELRYWDGNHWRSSGIQMAKNQYLDYKNVPTNTVYLLKNLSRGTEERIFTYENGKQVWW